MTKHPGAGHDVINSDAAHPRRRDLMTMGPGAGHDAIASNPDR